MGAKINMNKEALKAFVFPGQGSQRVEMGKEIHEAYGFIRDLYDRADEVLKEHGWTQELRDYCLDGPRNLTELCFQGPKKALGFTQFTQPALYVTSLAYYEFLYQVKGIHPKTVAGHSLGEYIALTAAGFLDFENGVILVADRGRFMAEAGKENPGKMVVILGQELETIERQIAERGMADKVFIANINCPGQIVLSGYEQSILEFARDFAEEIGERRVKIPDVSIAGHCKLMTPAAKKLRKIMEGVTFERLGSEIEPPIAFYSSTAGVRIDDPTKIKELLILQLTSRVQWTKTILEMIKDGYTHFIEVGPGKVLQGMIRRISKSVTVETFYDYH